MDILQQFEKQQVKNVDRPRLQPGDIVQVETKVVEGEKSRLQTFEGTVLGIRGSGPSTTFTVRRETARFGVERIFPLYSPLITDITIVKRQKVRRAKLNYLRQAGRRRFKEDVTAMQRHVREETRKQQLVEEAKKREEEKKAEEERRERQAKERAEKETLQQAQDKAEAAGESPSGTTDQETTENQPQTEEVTEKKAE